ncbi:MAG TPA: glycosyltransferase [Gemmatimonadaceae bacterium]
MTRARGVRDPVAIRLLFVETSDVWSARARAFFAAADALARRGSSVAFACPEKSSLARQARHLGHPVLPVKFEGSRWQHARALRTAIEAHFADVVFVQDADTHLAAALALRRAPSGAIVRRVPAGAGFPTDRRTRWADELAPTVYLVTSPSNQPELSIDLPVVDTVLGVDVPHDAPLSPAYVLSGPHLVCLASDDEVRPLGDMLRALRLLAERHPECRVTVGGIEARRDECRILAAAIGVADRVAWTNSDVAVRSLLRHASLAWVIADGDAGAFGCLDAMAVGTAVLGRRTRVVSRYLADATADQLLPELHPDLVAAATERLLTFSDRREAAVMAGHARAAADFNERLMVNGFLEAARLAHARERKTA